MGILEIARDFHKTRLSAKEIGRKYGISAKAVELRAVQIDPIVFFEDPDYCVIKVPREKMELAKLLLEEEGIKIDIPKKFELIETIESKINEEL